MAATDESFEDWLSRARPGLVRSARSVLQDHDEAENVVQDTLLAVWRARVTIESLDHYAKRAVRLNALRIRARRRERVAQGESEEPDAALPARREPEPALTAWELERAMLGLPPAQQVVLRLRFYGSLSFHEIGRSLAISINTAASRCRYALGALRRTFESNAIKKGNKP